MKKITYIIAATGLRAITAIAHEHGPGASTAGLFGLKAAYVHILLNPIPVYGLAIGLALLALGFIRHSRTLRTTGLAISAFCAASAWPVLYYGQHAYNSLAPMLDTESEQWLDTHMERAERFVYFFYATAALAIAALSFSRKSPKTRTVLSVISLLVGIASLGIGGWISRAGGQISHSEFRVEEAPPTAPAHQHGTHGDMEMPNTNGAHQHGASEESSETIKVPDTIEGVWTQIHKHHGELESAVTDKRFSDVQSHAKELSELTKKLVVESGVAKINHALDELKSSAETGSELVMKNNFKEFEEALKQLEEQMKKQ
ncbi:MAG: hypothetical protein ABI651_09495 [Verrucomicrobiota bacterium]